MARVLDRLSAVPNSVLWDLHAIEKVSNAGRQPFQTEIGAARSSASGDPAEWSGNSLRSKLRSSLRSLSNSAKETTAFSRADSARTAQFNRADSARTTPFNRADSARTTPFNRADSARTTPFNRAEIPGRIPQQFAGELVHVPRGSTDLMLMPQAEAARGLGRGGRIALGALGALGVAGAGFGTARAIRSRRQGSEE